MTTQPTPDSPIVEAPPFQVAPSETEKLAQLHARYASLKAEADAAAERLKAVTDAIKLALVQAAPNAAQRVELVGPGRPSLRLTYAESWRVDARKLKAEDPETYVRYAKKSGAWTLKALPGGEG